MPQEDRADYELRVEPATNALSVFSDVLISELDEQNGAFTWWSGYGDWKPLTLIADYLIQSVMGASAALLAASLAAKTHREALFADNKALSDAWRALAQSGETNPLAFTGAIPRDAPARRRNATITQSAEHCFFHLGQTLDRLAAALVIVGGFEQKDVDRVDWGTIDSDKGLLQELAGTATARRIQSAGSAGRQLQVDLLGPAGSADGHGTAEWLKWTRDTRNAMTHRSPATKFHVLLGNVNDGVRFVRMFYRQPRWSEIQSLVFAVPTGTSLFDAFVERSSDDVLDGCCDAMASLVVALGGAMSACWTARRANPAVIVQPLDQWRMIVPTESVSGFRGFGADLAPELARINFDSLITSDRGGKRWVAGRVLDARRVDWAT